MPTKRRAVIFLIVLSVMLFAKYMWGQDADANVGWDSSSACFGGPSAEEYMWGVMFYGPAFGMIVGVVKVFNRHMAARAGVLFNSEMVRLRL
jgi:hypothetical protein